MKELKERIIKEIENKATKRGILATKAVRVTLLLTDKEINKLDKMDINKTYTWELEGHKLYVSHVEECNNETEHEIPAYEIRLKDTLIWSNDKACEVTNIQTDETGNKIITYKYYDDGSKGYEKNSEKIDPQRLVKVKRG